jgi:hypothetical protein
MTYSLRELFFLAAVVFLAGCSALTGEEVGRLPINEVSSAANLIKKETQITLKKGDEIAIWSEMDIEYEGEVSLLFKVSIARDGEVLDVLQVDPRQKDMTFGEVKTSFGNKTNWSFSGRNAIFPIATDGTYTIEAILLASDDNSLVIKKAELVIKKI